MAGIFSGEETDSMHEECSTTSWAQSRGKRVGRQDSSEAQPGSIVSKRIIANQETNKTWRAEMHRESPVNTSEEGSIQI